MIYTIKPTTDNKCELISKQAILPRAYITAQNKQQVLKTGTTEEEINSQIKDINDGYLETKEFLLNTENICISSNNILTQYFKDSKNGIENIETSFHTDLSSSETNTTYTLSTGDKLYCKTIQ